MLFPWGWELASVADFAVREPLREDVDVHAGAGEGSAASEFPFHLDFVDIVAQNHLAEDLCQGFGDLLGPLLPDLVPVSFQHSLDAVHCG